MKTIKQPEGRMISEKIVSVERQGNDLCMNSLCAGRSTVTYLDKVRAQELVAGIVSVMGFDKACPGCPVTTNRTSWSLLPPMPAPPPPVVPAPTPKRRPHGAQEYKGNGKHKWEEVTVDAKGAGHTYRLRVPGGYLYRTVTNYQDAGDPMDGQPLASSTVFVPMPDVVGYAV